MAALGRFGDPYPEANKAVVLTVTHHQKVVPRVSAARAMHRHRYALQCPATIRLMIGILPLLILYAHLLLLMKATNIRVRLLLSRLDPDLRPLLDLWRLFRIRPRLHIRHISSTTITTIQGIHRLPIWIEIEIPLWLRRPLSGHPRRSTRDTNRAVRGISETLTGTTLLATRMAAIKAHGGNRRQFPQHLMGMVYLFCLGSVN